MEIGCFYFISPQYFQDFSNTNLMQNKPKSDGHEHNRPAFMAIKGISKDIYWVVPISSKVDKFTRIYQNKVQKYGKCDTIDFAYVLGQKRAFLIQNMFPITDKYILNRYNDRNSVKVTIDNVSMKRITQKANKVLTLHRKGFNLIYGKVLEIEKNMLKVTV